MKWPNLMDMLANFGILLCHELKFRTRSLARYGESSVIKNASFSQIK